MYCPFHHVTRRKLILNQTGQSSFPPDCNLYNYCVDALFISLFGFSEICSVSFVSRGSSPKCVHSIHFRLNNSDAIHQQYEMGACASECTLYQLCGALDFFKHTFVHVYKQMSFFMEKKKNVITITTTIIITTKYQKISLLLDVLLCILFGTQMSKMTR